MADDKVRVLARGTALCPDFDAADREPPLRRKLGRAYQQVSPGQWGWVPVATPEAVTKRAEVARAIADGDLWAADAETAAWAASVTCSPIKFDPTFGGTVQPAKADTKTKGAEPGKDSSQ